MAARRLVIQPIAPAGSIFITWELDSTALGRLSVAGDNLEDFVAEQVAANLLSGFAHTP
jgi:hypothetical protein